MKTSNLCAKYYLVTAANRALGIRRGEIYREDGRNLTLASPGGRPKILRPTKKILATGTFVKWDPLLPYPLVKTTLGPRRHVVFRYEIPLADRAKILKQLWLYLEEPPPLSANRFDLIAEKLFKVRDFVVIRTAITNLVFSPHGGTLIDWAPASWGRP